MIKHKLTGPVSYLVAAILFLAIGLPLFIGHIAHGSILAFMSGSAVVAGLFSLYFWRQAKQGKTSPGKNNTLFASSLMFLSGTGWLAGGIKTDEIVLTVIAALLVAISLPVLILDLVIIYRTQHEQETAKLQKVKKTYINILTGIIVAVAVSPVLIVGIGSLIKGDIVFGIIVLSVFGLVAGLFIFLLKRKNKSFHKSKTIKP